MQSKGSQIEYQHCLQFFMLFLIVLILIHLTKLLEEFLRIFYRKKTLWFFKIKGVWIALQTELKTSDESLIWEVLKDVYLAMSHARFNKTHNSFQILHCCVYELCYSYIMEPLSQPQVLLQQSQSAGHHWCTDHHCHRLESQARSKYYNSVLLAYNCSMFAINTEKSTK